ncbi:hypothetical protein Tco_0168017 [Tanacetum coccineum]
MIRIPVDVHASFTHYKCLISEMHDGSASEMFMWKLRVQKSLRDVRRDDEAYSIVYLQLTLDELAVTRTAFQKWRFLGSLIELHEGHQIGEDEVVYLPNGEPSHDKTERPHRNSQCQMIKDLSKLEHSSFRGHMSVTCSVNLPYPDVNKMSMGVQLMGHP